MAQTSSSVEQTSRSVVQTSRPVVQTSSSVEQTSSSPSSSSNSVSYLLANDISPIPKQTHPRAHSSAHRGKTAVITSSPYKSDLKKARSMSAGKGLSRKKTKTTKGKQQAPKQKTPSYGREHRCLYCDELFEMTSNDDCIRCTVCHRWAHDQCAGLE